jgi:hypothetical protein
LAISSSLTTGLSEGAPVVGIRPDLFPSLQAAALKSTGAAWNQDRFFSAGIGFVLQNSFLESRTTATVRPVRFGRFRLRTGAAIFEIVQEKCVRRHGLFDHQRGRFEVFRLQAAQFLQGAVERALGGGAGAIDEGLKPVEILVRHVFRRSRFEAGATAETPGGLDDFASEGLFERRGGRKLGHIAALDSVKMSCSSVRTKFATEKRPSLVTFWDTRALPSAVKGPWGRSAFSRLARIWAVLDCKKARITDRLQRYAAKLLEINGKRAVIFTLLRTCRKRTGV